MEPLVGIMPLWDKKKDSLWMLPGYYEALKQAGASCLIFPFTDDEEEIKRLVSICDGLLFTGGDDVDPSLYKEESIGDIVDPCLKRDAMEAIAFKEAYAQGKSILGICRGLQFINVMLGGSLYQDLQTQTDYPISHRQKAPYDKPLHNVDLDRGSPLQRCLDMDELPVNSCHHQGIKVLADPLEPMAKAKDGLIEAVYDPNKPFVWAVQWHPEFLFKVDEPSRLIFKAFADSMKGC